MQIKTYIFQDLQLNIDYLNRRFEDCNDIIKKRFQIGTRRNHACYLLYADGLVDYVMIQDNVIRPLLIDPLKEYPDSVENWIIESADRRKTV